MKKKKGPARVKLIVGMITNETVLFQKVEEILQRKFGRIDYASKVLDFKYTDYYTSEMGENLRRKFVSFERLILPSYLLKAKLFTIKLEKKFSEQDKRKINLDPGYLNEGKLVLASSKDNLQRIYLGKGIYAEVTLYYKTGNYQHFFWTYPDYRTEEYREIFQEIRKLFRRQLGRRE
jgi:hypothetical protein